jgi:DNA-binding transcriptional regulator YhcF (GntR family)
VPGQRLPSTRELARRYRDSCEHGQCGISSNWKSEGWLEFRHGSGVYVRASGSAAPLSPELATEFAVDQLIGDLMANARKLGATESQVRERLRRWMALAPPSRWLVIEPDAELRRIFMHEMQQALALPIGGCTPADCAEPGLVEGSMLVVAPSKAEMVRKLLPAGTELTVLQVHPISLELLAHLQKYMPEHAGELVGIASRWGEFQRIAQTLLIAAGLAPESLLVRDAAQAGWKRGLDATSGVVCDAVTALELPPGVFPLRFTLLDAPTLAGLRKQEESISAST